MPSTVGGRSGVAGYGASDSTRHRFTQKERDDESKLDYFLARYYSGVQGRFTGVDPENAGADPSDAQSWNGYAYARNNPLLYVDPTGLAYDFVVGEKTYRVNDATEFAKYGYKVIEFKENGDVLIIQDADGNQYTANFVNVPVNASVNLSGNFPDLLGPYRGVLSELDRSRSASNKLIAGFTIVTAVVGATGEAAAYFSGVAFGSGLTTLGIGAIRPITGQLFATTIQTSQGAVDVLAEIVVEGDKLILKDIVIYGRSSQPLTGLTREILSALSQLKDKARALGFKELQITGKRVLTSTSSNPGHTVNVTVKLQ